MTTQTKEKKPVKLNKEEIRKAIFGGDNAYGHRYLAIYPSGEWQIHWADDKRPWDPWGDDAQVIGIPALFPEGSGEENDLAEECLKYYDENPDDVEEAIEESRSTLEYNGLIEYADAKHGDWMEDARDNMLDFLEQAFLDACNGYGDELNDLTPWGTTGDVMAGDLEIVEAAFEFEWE